MREKGEGKRQERGKNNKTHCFKAGVRKINARGTSGTRKEKFDTKGKEGLRLKSEVWGGDRVGEHEGVRARKCQTSCTAETPQAQGQPGKSTWEVNNGNWESQKAHADGFKNPKPSKSKTRQKKRQELRVLQVVVSP